MRVDLAEDPAVIAMAAQLQVHETHVVGMLHKAWAWADAQVSHNGHAKNVTLSWLDRYIGATGFAQAMIDAGWLVEENGLKFPNFDRHNSDSAKKRASSTERKRAERFRHANVTAMSHLKRDKSVTREEKRRIIQPPLPDWIPIDAWDGWIASRKKKPTARAVELAVAKLTEFRNDGQDPKAVLDAATLGGWTGLYAIKGGDKQPPKRKDGLAL